MCREGTNVDKLPRNPIITRSPREGDRKEHDSDYLAKSSVKSGKREKRTRDRMVVRDVSLFEVGHDNALEDSLPSSGGSRALNEHTITSEKARDTARCCVPSSQFVRCDSSTHFLYRVR